jgi:hypothetical protein
MDTQPTPKSPRKWPSGMTFVMYCAGISLVLLTIYVITSKKDFEIDAKNAKLSTIKAGLIPQGVSSEAAEEKSSDLKEKFDQAKSQVVTASNGPTNGEGNGSNKDRQAAQFTGVWEGNGSTYELLQVGQEIILSERTNGIVTAYGEGTVSGEMASLTVQTALLPVNIQLTFENSNQVRVTGPGTFVITRQ